MSPRRERATLGLFRPRPVVVVEPTPLELLAFETEHGPHSSQKESRIHEVLRIRPARYYQLLLRAVLDPAAVAAYPSTARMVRDRVERKTR